MPNAGSFGGADAKPDTTDGRGNWEEETLQPGRARPRRNGEWQEAVTDDITMPMLVMLVGNNAGQAIPLEDDILIGRSRDASLVIERDDVSRRHAIIWKSPEGDFLLQDLDSRNGTRVNGLPIKKKVLEFGDVITIGRGAILMFTRREIIERPLSEHSSIDSFRRLNGGVVDDFNNLLGVIIGNVSYLKELYKSGDESLADSALESLSDAEAAAKRAATITNQLISFAHEEEELRRMGLEGQADRLIRAESANPGVRALIREALEVLTGSRLPIPNTATENARLESARAEAQAIETAVREAKGLDEADGLSGGITREFFINALPVPGPSPSTFDERRLPSFYQAVAKEWTRQSGIEPPPEACLKLAEILEELDQPEAAADVACRGAFSTLGTPEERGRVAEKALALYRNLVGRVSKTTATQLERLRAVYSETAAAPDPQAGLTVSDKPRPVEAGLTKEDLGDALMPRYRLIKKLGAGGMGEVHLAEDVELGRHVAIKVLQRSLATDLFIVKFKEEARIVAQLAHPGIVSIFDLGQRGHWSYIVMEYVDGPDLSTLVNSSRAFPRDRLLQIVSSVAEAMAYAHRQGVIHRDLKPANILVGPGDHPKVTDFGIAKVLQPSQKDTAFSAAGLQVGTVSYMAPEQIRGNIVDQRTDLYLLGTTLYLCLAGTFPFVGDTVAAQKLESDPTPIRVRVPNLSEDLDRCVMRSLERSPDARFPNMNEFAEALRRTPEARGIIF